MRAKAKKQGVVKKIIRPVHPDEPEKAEITVKGADPLYREIRIENTLENDEGKIVHLKEGAEVDVVVEAEQHATTAKHH